MFPARTGKEKSMRRFLIALAAICLAGTAATEAAAQLSVKPYEFPGRGGSGMSQAARQAIMLNAVDPDFRPDFLMRSPSDDLLVPVPMPRGKRNNVPALVAPFSGQVTVPPYFRDFWAGIGMGYGAGIFNPFFMGRSDSRIYVTGSGPDSITIWTARVLGTGGFGATSDAIDDWTAAAYALPRGR